jgi:hypothetical protein
MSRPCPAHRPCPSPMPVRGAGEQQLNLAVIVEAHPLAEVAAAQVILLALEVIRDGGIVVHHIHLDIDG